MDQFEDYAAMAAYLAERGWVTAEHAHAVECALAAFQGAQRRKGSQKARDAMNMAAEKAW